MPSYPEDDFELDRDENDVFIGLVENFGTLPNVDRAPQPVQTRPSDLYGVAGKAMVALAKDVESLAERLNPVSTSAIRPDVPRQRITRRDSVAHRVVALALIAGITPVVTGYGTFTAWKQNRTNTRGI